MSAEAQTVTENRFCTLYRATPTSMQMTLPGFVASRAHRHTFSDPCSTMPVTAAFREVRAQSQQQAPHSHPCISGRQYLTVGDTQCVILDCCRVVQPALPDRPVDAAAIQGALVPT
jgi:hypothetical protein